MDLSQLNYFVSILKFKIETFATVLLVIRKGDWMVSVDFKELYFKKMSQFLPRSTVCQSRIFCL